MIIPSHSFGVVASSRPRIVVAGGEDSTPNAINWSSADYDAVSGNTTSSTKQITGINVPITLYVTISGGAVGTRFYYYRSAQTDYWGDQQIHDTGTITNEASVGNGTYSSGGESQFTISNVSNNDYVTFFVGDFLNNVTYTITVRTGSHSGTTIDTFTSQTTGNT